MESLPTDALLVARDLWFRYPSSDWVLRGVSLSVGRGELVLVLGASGSGKTTLLRALTGIGIWVYGGQMRGEVLIGGRSVQDMTLEELRKAVQVVNQNAYTHFLEHTVGLDLYYSSTAIHGPERGERVFRKAVSAFKLEGVLSKRFFELSGGQLRRAAIAKAMLWDPQVVILDEPLMWLDDEGLGELREVLVTLKSMGRVLLVFEHRFLGLLDLASRVYVLRGGTLSSVEHGELRHPRKAPALHRGPEPSPGAAAGGVKPMLRADNLWFRYEKDGEWLLRGVDLAVENPGESLIVFGQNGSGKSTLLKLLAGYLTPERGRVWKTPRVRTVYVPQNVYLFFTEESLRRELEVVCPRRRSECLERGLATLKSLGADLDVEASPFNLSWGQAVRAAISIATSAGNDAVLLLDEPFTGLTYADRLSLAKLLARMEVPKILTVSNRETLSLLSPLSTVRVYELREGRLSAIKPEADPEAISAAERCRELGVYGVT